MHTLDSLRLQRVELLGFSLGSMVAMRLALKQPQRVGSLVLMSGSGGAEDGPRRARFSLLAGLARQIGVPGWMSAQAAAAMFSAAARRQLPEQVAQWRRGLEQMPAAAVANVVGMVARRDSVLPELARLPHRTLVISGELDGTTPPAHARALAAAMPGARLELVAGAGHALPIERPEATLLALQNWWRAGTEPGRPTTNTEGVRHA